MEPDTGSCSNSGTQSRITRVALDPGYDAEMLSIIISTHNSERPLVPTLAALIPGAMSGLVREAIVTDAGSNDATLAVADVAGCTALATPGPLGARLAAAAAAARAPWLLFLRAGTVLDATWVDETAQFIADAGQSREALSETSREDLPAAVFRPAASSRASQSLSRELLAAIRLGPFRSAHPDQGLLIATKFYRDIGGHRAGAADTEADLLKRIGRRRIVILRSSARAPQIS